MNAQTGSDRPGKDEPEGFLVEMVPGERIHFLDWGRPDPAGAVPSILLIHGLSQTTQAQKQLLKGGKGFDLPGLMKPTT